MVSKASLIWGFGWLALLCCIVFGVMLIIALIKAKHTSKEVTRKRVILSFVFMLFWGVVLLVSYRLSLNPDNSYAVKYDNSAVRQFDRVNYDDFDIKVYPFLRPSRKPNSLEISVAVISSKQLTLTIDKKYEKVIKYKDYLASKQVDFTYDGKDTVHPGEDLDIEKIKGTITYEDGSKGEVDVKYIKVDYEKDKARVTISDGINSFTWMPKLSSK